MIKRKMVKFPTSTFFLFGPRQTGKTTAILSSLKEKKIPFWHVNLLLTQLYLAYEKDPSQFTKDALYQIKNKKVKIIFVDEVQKVPNLLDEVHQLIESFKDVQFILSGSSARKLKRGGANLLGGRALVRNLFPLSIYELENKFNLNKILTQGSLPSIYLSEPEESLDKLNAYTETYLKEEILSEGLVRNIGSFHRFLEVAAQHTSEIINYENIARESATKGKTVKGYFEILSDTLIGFILPAWDQSVRKQLALHPKFYFFDNGIISGTLGTLDSIKFPDFSGKLFEQWIINEVKAYISYNLLPIKMHFWRTTAGNEVDLILSYLGKPIAAIEIKYVDDIGKKHLSGLKSFRDEYPDSELILISKSDRSSLFDDVQILSISDFFNDKLIELMKFKKK